MPHADPLDPPRRRANRFHGRGTWGHDRPPVLGVVSRAAGKALTLAVVATASRAELEPRVLAATAEGAAVYTDECLAYRRLGEGGRRYHAAVNHNAEPREFARDDDGDGVREVHCNTMEGIWTGLRNFLRPFRGVSKHYLAQYVAVFQWCHNAKAATFLHALLRGSTGNGT